MARPQSEVLAGRETRRRRLRLVPVSTNVFKEPPHRIRRRNQAQSRLSDQETVFTSPGSLSEQLDNPISPLNGSMLIAEKEKKPESREKRRPIILALARLNAAQTEPEFPSVFDKRLIEEVYADKNLDQDGMKNPIKIKQNGGAAFQARNDFIAILEDPGSHSEVVVRRTMALVDEIRNLYPYYRDLTISQVIGILKRTIDFSEIIKQVTVPVEEVLPDGFVVRSRTYIPPKIPSGEVKSLPIPADGNNHERIHLPPKKRKLEPRIVFESKELPEDALPKLPKLLNNMTREEIVAYSLMLVADNMQGFRYSNAQTAVRRIHDDPISGANKLSRRSKAEIDIPSAKEANAILESFVKKLTQYDESDETHTGSYHASDIVHNFVRWADKQPLYQGYNPQELAEVLIRHTPFIEIVNEYRERGKILRRSIRNTTQERLTIQEEARLSLEGQYLISNLLWDMSTTELARLGIDITEQSAETISKVIDSFESQNHEGDPPLAQAIGPVVIMLRELFNNPSVLLKRVKDLETKQILQTLVSLRPSKREDIIRQLMSSG